MPTRVRLYHQVRTAHLERAAQLPSATILFANKRYDFHESLASELDLVHARGFRAAWWLFRHPVETLEINEPLMLVAARSTATALVGVTLRRLLGGPRTRVVTYAIENLNPTGTVKADPAKASPVKARLKRQILHRLDQALAGLIWKRVDRIAYGTSAAQELYEQVLPSKDSNAQSLIWALPAPAEDAVHSKDPCQVLFLGAFSDRKGFPLVREAWDKVRAVAPGARLQLIGKGPQLPLAEELAAADDSVTLTVDPPRDQIRNTLARSQVLVLPSQPSATWREQVGLPIVEGLSYGCTVVTTTETGLADWLVTHGHQVVTADAGPDELARAITAALRRPVPDVLDSLPEEDGRLAADAWLFS